jgi:hypothetical protein
MKRRLVLLAIPVVILYAALAIGAANCLVLHAEQTQAHHHSHSHVTHSALCAWACQINPPAMVSAPIPLIALSAVVARVSQIDSSAGPALVSFQFTSRAPPRA